MASVGPMEPVGGHGGSRKVGEGAGRWWWRC